MSGLSATEIEIFLKGAGDFVTEKSATGRVRTYRDEKDPLAWSRPLYQEMVAMGWTAVAVPESSGGLGLGFETQCLLLEQAGGHLVPEPLVSTAIATQVLMGSETPEARALLSDIASGAAIVAFADGGQIDLENDRLTGHIDGVPDVYGATAYLVATDTGLYLVDGASSGVEIYRQWRIDGRNAGVLKLSETSAIRLGDQALVTRARDCAAIAISAEMLGGAEQAFRTTVAYLKTREQFGVAIGTFQSLQHRAARMYIEIGLLRSAVYGAAECVDDDASDCARFASLAKATAGDTYLFVANQAIQLHGGIGVTDECDIGLYLKRARVSEVTWGTASAHRSRWATLGGY
jgi:acyl-CoA dehydrogenase